MKNVVFTFLILLFCSSTSIALPLQVKPTIHKRIKKVSFDEIYSRYPSPFAVFHQLERIFPSTDSSNCGIFDEDTSSLGMNDPMLGLPLEKEPGALFFQYYQGCIRFKASYFSSSVNFEKSLEEIFNVEALTHLLADQRITLKELWGSRNWDYGFSEKEQDLILKQFIFYLVGPDQLLREMKYIGKDNIFGAPIESSDDLAAFFRKNIVVDQGSDNSRLIKHFYIELAIVLRLGPALKD